MPTRGFTSGYLLCAPSTRAPLHYSLYGILKAPVHKSMNNGILGMLIVIAASKLGAAKYL